MERKLDIPINMLYSFYGKETFQSWKAVQTLENRLAELRGEKGISQEELASALEVSRQTIGSLENGRYNPSILLAYRIAHYFNKTIEEIFLDPEERQ